MSDKAPGSPNNRRKISMKLQHSSGLKKKTKTRTANEQMVIVQQVIPNVGEEGKDPCSGFVVTPTCYADRTIKQVLYLNGKHDIKVGFLENTSATARICHASKQGTIIVNDWNNKSYPRNSLVCIIEANENQVRDHVNRNICESLQLASKFFDDDDDKKEADKGLQDSALPKMREGQDFFVVNHWNKVLHRQSDIEFVINGACEGSFSSWIKEDKNHLYSLYPEGEVPLKVMRKYNLQGSHLRPLDKTRLIADMNAIASEAVAGLTAEANAGSENNNN